MQSVLKRGLCLMAAAVASTLAGTAAAETLRVAHVVSTGHIYHKAAEHLAKELGSATGGQYEVRIFPNGQLGQEHSLIEALRSGNLDLAFVSSANTAAFIAPMGVFSLPYIFKDSAHVGKVLNDPSILSILDGYVTAANPGFRRVSVLPSGERHFFSNKKVISDVEGLSGAKIRVPPSPIASEVWSTLGALPVGLPLGDVYTSLQTGLIDAYEGPITSYYLSKMYEVAPFASLTGHEHTINFLLVSEKTWAALPDEVKRHLETLGSGLDEFALEILAATDKEHAALLTEKHGVTIGEVDRSGFVERLSAMQATAVEKIGAGELFQKLKGE
jgi:tripartite ATP-independent transporter DctP family solute receptor